MDAMRKEEQRAEGRGAEFGPVGQPSKLQIRRTKDYRLLDKTK